MKQNIYYLWSKNMFKNDLCLACLGPHYSTNTTTLAPKLLEAVTSILNLVIRYIKSPLDI